VQRDAGERRIDPGRVQTLGIEIERAVRVTDRQDELLREDLSVLELRLRAGMRVSRAVGTDEAVEAPIQTA
jgi:hypothetical protein